MNFVYSMRNVTFPQFGRESRTYHNLTVSPPEDGVLLRAMCLPSTDLLVGDGPMLARPFATGLTQLYAMRQAEVRTLHQIRELKILGACLLSLAVFNGALYALRPNIGKSGHMARGVVHIALLVASLYFAVQRRMEVQALGAALMLSRGWDEMEHVTPSAHAAQRYLDVGHEALRHARVLTLVDPRIGPAAEQYASRYNLTFGGSGGCP